MNHQTKWPNYPRGLRALAISSATLIVSGVIGLFISIYEKPILGIISAIAGTIGCLLLWITWEWAEKFTKSNR